MDARNAQIAQKVLDLAYNAASNQEFNQNLKAQVPGVSKVEIQRALREYLKAGKGLPQNGQQALRFLTYIPTSAFRESPIFENFMKVMSPEEKKKIPNPSGIWGEQPLLHAKYQTLARILNRQ